MLSLDHVEAPIILNLPLPPKATIVVIGAYQGSTVRFIRNGFPESRIFAYEPQKFAYDILIKDLGLGIKAYNFGLGVKTVPEAKLYEADTDAASLIPLPNSRLSGTVEIIDAREAFVRDEITHIDFMFMNIEGYEYYLLPYILGLDGIRVDSLLVQFHFKEKYFGKYSEIGKYLEGLGYNYLYVGAGWELWRR